MISYVPTARHFLSLRGSVFPRAVGCGLASALITVAVNVVFDVSGWAFISETRGLPISIETTAIAVILSAVSFLLVFRSQIAYSRYWQGNVLVERIHGGWLNATSSCFAFCSPDPAKRDEVVSFQASLAQLMILLFSASLRDISTSDYIKIPIAESGIDSLSMAYLEESTSKQEIIMQWVQRLIVDNARKKVLDIEPPILSRVFQELSNGIVNLHEARTLSYVPFPFPWAQMSWTIIVLLSGLFMPWTFALYITMRQGVLYAFLCTVTLWSIYYTALEIEMPFGDDANHLPLLDVQKRFKDSIAVLIRHESQNVPTFESILRRRSSMVARDDSEPCLSAAEAMDLQAIQSGGSANLDAADLMKWDADADRPMRMKAEVAGEDAYAVIPAGFRGSDGLVHSIQMMPTHLIPNYTLPSSPPSLDRCLVGNDPADNLRSEALTGVSEEMFLEELSRRGGGVN